MKYLLISLLLMSNISFAGKSLPPAYNIVSDKPSSSVPDGMCRIKGVAWDYGTPINEGKVSTLNGKYQTFTDSTGAYEILISANDTSLFFFKSQFSEVVIWSYKFKSGHEVVINFNPGVDQLQLEVDKPVIYLYSEKDVEVELDLRFKGDLTFTYPEYKHGWKAKVGSEGLSVEEKPYPYLFWEGTMTSMEYNKTDGHISGAVIKKHEIVNFLVSSLDDLGFNSTEKTDFITFWAPRMIAHNYLLVQFIVDADYDSEIAELNVNPIPDASRRVYMKFTGYQSDPEIDCQNQSFTPFSRAGLTLLEWGGSEIKAEAVNL